MPKAITHRSAEMRSRRVLDFKPIPLNQYDRSVTRRAGGRQRHEGRPGAHPARHDDHPRVRGDARLGQETGAFQGHPIQSSRPGPSFDRSGGGRRRPGLLARRGRPHLRFAPLPRRNSGQEPLGNSQAQRQVADVDHDATTSAATACASSRRAPRARRRIWRSTSSSTVRWRRSLPATPA